MVPDLSHPDTLVDVFADRATPTARQLRPALFAARMAWGLARIAAEHARPAPPRAIGGIAVGDEVRIQTAPGVYQFGVVEGWVRPDPDARSPVLATQTLARVRIGGETTGAVVQAPRWRLQPGSAVWP